MPAASEFDQDTAFLRHRGPVTSVAGLPGGRACVSGGYDGAVALADLENMSIELLGYHDHLINKVTVDQSGLRAASSSSDYTIGIWNLRERRRTGSLVGHGDDVEDFIFIDESTGISVSRDRRIIVWNLQTGAIERIIEGHDKDVLAVACDHCQIYTSGDDMTLRVWDLGTGDPVRIWGPFKNETDTCGIDSINRRAVLGCDDGIIRIFDIDNGSMLAEIKAHKSGIKRVAISPSNGDILSAAYDQRILIWDSGTLALRAELEQRITAWERSLTWSHRGTEVLGGTFDGTVLRWDAESGRCLAEIGQPEPGNVCLNDLAADDAGDLVTVSDDGVVRRGMLTASAARWSAAARPPSGRVLSNAVTTDPLGGVVIAGTHNQRIQTYRKDPRDGLAHLTELTLGEGPVNCLRVATSAGYRGQVFAACYSGMVVRVDPACQILARFRAHDGAVKALRLHPERDIGVSCSADGTVVSWNYDGEILSEFPGHLAIVNDLDLDPAGSRVATVSRDFTLRIYQLADGRLLDAIALGHHSPKSVCFADPDLVVVGTYWGEIAVVRLSTKKVQVKHVAENGISALALSGTAVLGASYDGSIYRIVPDSLEVENVLTAMRQRLQPSKAARARQERLMRTDMGNAGQDLN
jgi:WD40 repeat protein